MSKRFKQWLKNRKRPKGTFGAASDVRVLYHRDGIGALISAAEKAEPFSFKKHKRKKHRRQRDTPQWSGRTVVAVGANEAGIDLWVGALREDQLIEQWMANGMPMPIRRKGK